MKTEDDKQDNQRARLYREILRKIVAGEYPPGQRLIEESLAREHDVSRTPVREVLALLEGDGLVKRVRNRGAQVMSFTADDIEEIYEIRKALECHCAAHVIVAKTVTLSELHDFEREMLRLLNGSGAKWREQVAEADLKLHLRIVQGTNNKRLSSYMQSVSLLREALQLVGYGDEEHVRHSAEQHVEIIRGLLARNVERTRHLLAEHLEYGKRVALEVFFQRSNHGDATGKAVEKPKKLASGK
jgi:DNA-binding GntR family transcriptional regulator